MSEITPKMVRANVMYDQATQTLYDIKKAQAAAGILEDVIGSLWYDRDKAPTVYRMALEELDTAYCIITDYLHLATERLESLQNMTDTTTEKTDQGEAVLPAKGGVAK